MIYLNTLQIRDCTIGELEFEDFKCFTLELPWRFNASNISCIPAGTYEIEKYDSAANGKCLLLSGVTGRTWIQIHSGNFTRDTLGCVLVGDGIRDIDRDNIPDVVNSVKTMQKLLYAVPERTQITIRRYGV